MTANMIMTSVFLCAGLLGAYLFVAGQIFDKLWMRCLGVVGMFASGADFIIGIIRILVNKMGS